MGSAADFAPAAGHFALGATGCARGSECFAGGLVGREVIDTPSPCVDICSVDATGEYCTGCGRTLGEIAGWSKASESERRAVVEQLPERLLRLQS